MKKSIYLSTDINCWSKKQIQENKLGGTEHFFLILRDWLLNEGYLVYDPVINPTTKKVDLTICSNNNIFPVKTEKKLLWSGSWHSPINNFNFDKSIVVSAFMKKKGKYEQSVVLPVPYSKNLEKYKNSSFIKNRLCCTSNPNRWFYNVKDLFKFLLEKNFIYELWYAGGNKLYSQNYSENFSSFIGNNNLFYAGLLPKYKVFELLSTTNIWIYPNFQDVSETFCVAMLEAAALNIPIILPAREPFVSVFPEAFFVNSCEEMVNKIEDILLNGPDRINYDISRYSEQVVMPQYLKLVEEII